MPECFRGAVLSKASEVVQYLICGTVGDMAEQNNRDPGNMTYEEGLKDMNLYILKKKRLRRRQNNSFQVKMKDKRNKLSLEP